MLLNASPRIRLAATSVFLLALMGLGMAVTMVNLNTLGSAGWHLAVNERATYRRGCQYSFRLTAAERPEWLEHRVHWATQNRIRKGNQTRMVMTLYVSGAEQSLFVMGLVSTYDVMVACAPSHLLNPATSVTHTAKRASP